MHKVSSAVDIIAYTSADVIAEKVGVELYKLFGLNDMIIYELIIFNKKWYVF